MDAEIRTQRKIDLIYQKKQKIDPTLGTARGFPRKSPILVLFSRKASLTLEIRCISGGMITPKTKYIYI